MEEFLQKEFKDNQKMYDYLKFNSYYFKALDRGNITFKQFQNDMKVKYKERATDKISSAFENINTISSILDILK